ncbi:MAG: extracellular solute-binding protein [Clostridium sp.]|nr:extracellular solute-binding protein [Clostridium sp.]
MMKKVVALGLSCVMAISLLAGCGNSGGGSSDSSSADNSAASTDETQAADSGTEADTSADASADAGDAVDYSGREEIKYWYCWGGDSETWDQWRMDEFNKSQDKYYITGQYVPESSGVNNGKLMAAIQSGDVPDVIVCDNANGTYSLASQGAFEDITDAINSSGFNWDGLNSAVEPVMQYDGATYFYPANTDAVLLFIRNDMAEAAGLDLSNPPKTTAELDEWADAMTKVAADGSVECYGFIPWLDGGESGNWSVQFGAQLYDEATDTYTVNNDKMVSMYEWMRSYAQKFDSDILMGFTSNLGGAFSPDHAFFTGDVGMTVNGNWFCEALKQYAPDIEYTIAPMPAATLDLYGGTPITANLIACPKGAKNIDGAIAWANFCQTAEIMEENNATWLSLPIFEAESQNLTRVASNDPAAIMCVEVTYNENSRFFCISPKTAQLIDNLKTALDESVYTDNDIKASLEEVDRVMNE